MVMAHPQTALMPTISLAASVNSLTQTALQVPDRVEIPPASADDTFFDATFASSFIGAALGVYLVMRNEQLIKSLKPVRWFVRNVSLWIAEHGLDSPGDKEALIESIEDSEQAASEYRSRVLTCIRDKARRS